MIQTREETQVRQKQIVNAAAKLIIKHGSEHLTVGKIAREVGISEAAIYRHFKSKNQILSFLVDHVESDLLSDIAAVDHPSGYTSLQILDKILRSHLSVIKKRHGISFQIIAEIISLGDRKLNRKVTSIIDRYVSYLKGLLTEGVNGGEVREDLDLESAALLLFGMTQGLVNIWALANYGFDLEQRYASLWKVFRQAVVRFPSGPQALPEP